MSFCVKATSIVKLSQKVGVGAVLNFDSGRRLKAGFDEIRDAAFKITIRLEVKNRQIVKGKLRSKPVVLWISLGRVSNNRWKIDVCSRCRLFIK